MKSTFVLFVVLVLALVSVALANDDETEGYNRSVKTVVGKHSRDLDFRHFFAQSTPNKNHFKMVPDVVDKADFDMKLRSAGKKLVVVDFYAPWCKHCQEIAPKLEGIATANADKIIVLKVEVEKCEDLTELYAVYALPTFVFVKDGMQVERLIGADVSKLKSTIAKLTA